MTWTLNIIDIINVVMNAIVIFVIVYAGWRVLKYLLKGLIIATMMLWIVTGKLKLKQRSSGKNIHDH